MTTTACDLSSRHCTPCEGGIAPLSAGEIQHLLADLKGWAVVDGKSLVKTYPFSNYYETLAFVNATAWVSHHEDHHPDLEVGYKHCRVRYITHAIDGLSENDFICAARIDALLPARSA
jgi:4a-hydroxytetrahydrobiopterin dehydratase